MNPLLPFTAEENTERMLASVSTHAAASKDVVVFLVDGDRTLSPDDTSRDFAASAGVDARAIKNRFARDGYVFDAFRFHAEMHLAMEEAAFAEHASKTAAMVKLHPGAEAFLFAARQRGRVFVVSAGIPRIWRILLDRLGLLNIEVIGGIEPRAPFVFGRQEKGVVARMFKRHARLLVAVGDSDVDTEMLRRADHAVVVMNHRRNADLLPGLVEHSSLWQVVPDGEAHVGIRELSFENVAGLADMKKNEGEAECR